MKDQIRCFRGTNADEIMKFTGAKRAIFNAKLNRLCLYFDDENFMVDIGGWVQKSTKGLRLLTTEQIFGSNWRALL